MSWPEEQSLKELTAACNANKQSRLYRGPLWRDKAYWNMRLSLIWIGIYETFEEYLDARDGLNLYRVLKDPTTAEIR